MAEALSLRKSIEELAQETKRFCSVSQIPVDVERAVRRLGGSIQATSSHSVMKEKYCRGILKTGDRSFTLELYTPKVQYEMDPLIHEYGLLHLTVDDWKKISHGRNEIAHLLGHLLLHMGYQNPLKWERQEQFRDSIKYFLEVDFARKEMEANQFAQAFLMPEEAFKKAAQHFFEKEEAAYHLGPIARRFAVPERAVREYGERLGLFKKLE